MQLKSVCMFIGWILLVPLLALLLPGLQAFKPLLGKSVTHRHITEMAILRKTTEVCQALATAQGRDFPIPTDGSPSASAVQRACSSSEESVLSGVKFKASIIAIYLSNAAMDVFYLLSESYHFDDEAFAGGQAIITEGIARIKASVQQRNFISARLTLGQISHTIQDFYSHSNWIELGKRHPNSNLIRPDQSVGSVADKSTPTCRSCNGDDCMDNILPEIIREGQLTSGYFSTLSSSKPAGKCSHGGFFDRTSSQDPVGGINKDDEGADHGPLHKAAANMAVDATMELLEDIRGATGENDFLELMGITRSSILCFVIDTTGSMSDDIEEAKRVAFSIIDSKKGTQNEPSAYFLVPFNDPEFGPLTSTADSKIFKERIDVLTATGGGDSPEMCLSGLLLALTSVPPSSDIFVFTDAPAKDTDLRSTVIALIESTKSVVNFLLTNALSARRRRNSQDIYERSAPGNELYQELAETSGGQAIEVTKNNLAQATDIIVDSSTSALVTVLQVVRNPGRPDNFTFTVDASMRNLTIYIIGSSLTFSLTSPSGAAQDSSVSDGPLGEIKAVGNLHTFRVETQIGLWEVSVTSTQSYTVKVTGQSSIDFVYNLVEHTKGSERDFILKEGRFQAGGNATLLLSLVGSDTLTVTDVSLVEASSSKMENGILEALSTGDYVISFEKVPTESFVILVKGVDGTRSSHQNSFQRQSTTQLKASSLTVTASANGTMEPGSPFNVSFIVMSNGTTGSYVIDFKDDKGFITSAPTRYDLLMDDTGSAQGTVKLQAPDNTASGTEVVLTITAELPGGGDSNYAMLRISVLSEVTDFTRPVCQVVSVNNNCSENCSQSQWELSANLTDGSGTGIQSVTVRVGDGTLNTTTSLGEEGINVTVATYSATCCSPEVELVVVDAVGNVGTCFQSIRETPITRPASPTTSHLNAATSPHTNGSAALYVIPMALLAALLIYSVPT